MHNFSIDSGFGCADACPAALSYCVCVIIPLSE
jgi:hypothetical protein